ncbi:MAG: methionine--tRNA ligase, partial [Deltaproteobacteria bacterium]|nr:methionine--tRNA ligase [Deltaproteobacteria bacterium]
SRMRGGPTRFLTGLDEHGQKIERRAAEENVAPQAYADRMSPPFREAFERLSCTYDDFIRTTEERHTSRVQDIWRRVRAAGDLYLGDYEGWYCVADEAFYTEKELVDGKSPTGRPVERVREPSCFFRLSKFQDRLLEHYARHPDFVRPEGRFNEVKSFVESGLLDLSVSRVSFRWGIPVPDEPAHVMYVWFDALANYVTALGIPDAQSELGSQFWPPSGRAVHLIGKDILRFHAVYWPAFLMSAGLPLPSQVFAHGFLTLNGERMSKTTRNTVEPRLLADVFGTDVVRYYLMREVAFGQDGDFAHSALIGRYNSELVNDFGNLVSRTLGLVARVADGKVPTPSPAHEGQLERDLQATALRVAAEAGDRLDSIEPHRALETIWELCRAANQYVDKAAPWSLAKRAEDQDRLATVLYTMLEACRFVSVMAWPVMPAKCDEARKQLGLPPLVPTLGKDLWPSVWGGLVPGTSVAPAGALFPRLDKDGEKAALDRLGVRASETSAAQPPKKEKPQPSAAPTADADGLVSYDTFGLLDLRVARVVTAERVPKSDKLLKLAVDLGEPEPRQIIAGIGKRFEPEALVGKTIVVVANLKPAKLMGLESRGMVLAAGPAEGLELVTLAGGDVPPGTRVK